MRRLHLLAFAAAVVFVVATVLVLSAHWYLVCGDQQGIDCFDENVAPHTHSVPARWFGFVPLAIAAVTGALTALGCIVAEYLRAGRARLAEPAA